MMVRNILRTVLLSAGAGSLALAAPAMAQDWKAALAAGKIGERTNGKLAVVDQTDASLEAMVNKVNIERTQTYITKAQEQNTTAEAYAFTVACQLIAKLPAGAKYQAPDGSWQTKGAGPAIRDPRCS